MRSTSRSPADSASPPRCPRPAPRPCAQAERREDDPPPEVPRDQWERPIIVAPDGSGAESYLRASKLGKVTRGRALIKWDERNIVYGMSRANHLVVRAQGVRTLTARPDLAVLEDVAAKAKIVAGADAGAMTGSGMHALHARRAAGEDLSWLSPTTVACLDAITALLDPRIFEIIVTEGDDDLGRTFVVHDRLRAAGSFDLVVRLLVDLTWPDGVTVPAGTVLVVDLKTGKITSGPYWGMEFTGQQLVYAEGTPYRPGVTHLADPKVRSVKNVIKVTGQPGDHGRITWADLGVPERPCRRWSLILHVPALSPGDAHWERVDLDAAREDAAAARAVWDRDRVGRADRFLALPAAALIVPGVELPATGSAGVDTDVSTSSESIMNAKLHATLRERIRRADSTDRVDAIYDAWGKSPTWDDELTAACQAVYDRLDSPPGCAHCDADSHTCPGCGTGVAHGGPVVRGGVTVCPPCSLRVALDEAPDRATIALLWDAHGPDGDGIWTEQHQDAGKARYAALPSSDEWPDLDTADEAADDVDALPVEPPEPGPFDHTTDLADLRDLIEQALDTDTLDELYDAHGPVSEGGDGLWTDDLNAPAQAAYDRLSGQQGAGTGTGT